MRDISICLFFICTCFVTISCSQKPDVVNFDSEAFDSKGKYKLILCFDLRNDVRPVGGVVINGTAQQSSQAVPTATPSSLPAPPQIPKTLHSLILPFASSDVAKNIKLLNTWSSYNDLTIINYISPLGNSEVIGIGVTPLFSEQPEKLSQIEDLKGNVYLLRSGLERRFIYKYFSSTSLPQDWPTEVEQIPRDILDAIGVAIPADAQGLEIRKNMMAIPGYEFENGKARFFAAYVDRIDAKHLPENTQNKADVKYLEVKYTVQASKPLKIAGEVAPKILLAIAVPVLELIFLPSRGRRRRLWVGLIVTGIVIETIILGFLLWSALSIRGEFQEKVIVEIINVVANAIFSGVIIYLKSGHQQQAGTAQA